MHGTQDVLVVIDIQNRFLQDSTFHRISWGGPEQKNKLDYLETCYNILKRASEYDVPIFLVEYSWYTGENHDPTEYAIIPPHYKNIEVVIKTDDDGSSNIVHALRNRGILDPELWVIGLNRACCVADTCRGLYKNYGRPVNIIYEGTACSSGKPFDFGRLKEMSDIWVPDEEAEARVFHARNKPEGLPNWVYIPERKRNQVLA